MFSTGKIRRRKTGGMSKHEYRAVFGKNDEDVRAIIGPDPAARPKAREPEATLQIQVPAVIEPIPVVAQGPFVFAADPMPERPDASGISDPDYEESEESEDQTDEEEEAEAAAAVAEATQAAGRPQAMACGLHGLPEAEIPVAVEVPPAVEVPAPVAAEVPVPAPPPPPAQPPVPPEELASQETSHDLCLSFDGVRMETVHSQQVEWARTMLCLGMTETQMGRVFAVGLTSPRIFSALSRGVVEDLLTTTARMPPAQICILLMLYDHATAVIVNDGKRDLECIGAFAEHAVKRARLAEGPGALGDLET